MQPIPTPDEATAREYAFDSLFSEAHDRILREMRRGVTCGSILCELKQEPTDDLIHILTKRYEERGWWMWVRRKYEGGNVWKISWKPAPPSTILSRTHNKPIY